MTKTESGVVEIRVQRFVNNAPGVRKGRIVRDVSLHSDLYSVGCIFYFLGSEGRNPERFMRQFADDFAIDLMTREVPLWAIENPLFHALCFCQAGER